MSSPTVCCVMLTRDRPEMSRRAVESFRRQTYDPAKRRLLIVDGGDPSWYDPRSDAENEAQVYCDSTGLFPGSYRGTTIGSLRNYANSMAGSDIIAHWDSDDASHSSRIEEQVALLQASGTDAVGYNSMLFWDTRECAGCGGGRGNMLPFCPDCGLRYNPSREVPVKLNQAWLYRDPNPTHMCGTSMLYWRAAWERQPFDDIMTGEDTRWITKQKKTAGVSAVLNPQSGKNLSPFMPQGYEPRMIASIHGGNTTKVQPERDHNMWRRVPEFDSYCADKMRL